MPAAILPAVSPDAFAAARRADRLRLAAATARDPFDLPCWTPAPTYAPGTLYQPGCVVTSNGRLYVAVSGGTSPAAAAAPSHISASAVSDGAVLWTHAGEAPAAASVDPLAPAMTVSTDYPPLGNVVSVIGNPLECVAGAIAPLGGYVFNYGGFPGLHTLNRGPDVAGQHVGWEFETDEPDVCVAIFGGDRPVQFVIDGRRWSPGGVVMPGISLNYIRFTFPGQERRARRFRVEFGSAQMALYDVRIAGTGQVWAPARDTIRAVFISDSIVQGSGLGPFIAGGSVAQRVSGALGWSDPWDFAIGGTGYVNPGAGFLTFGQRVAEALTRSPDMWVFMGSGNDFGHPPAEITAAALAAFRAIRSGGSTAPVIVLGIWPKDGSAAQMEPAIKAAFDAFADPASAWVPIAGDASGVPWITGAWNNAGHPAAANAPALIGDDANHPIDLGTAYLARRIVRAIRADVLPRL